METFHMVVLGVATVILIGMLVSIGFMLKKGSRAVTYPPVPSACPDKWIAGTDANGTTCAINDASFNMSQIVAVGTTAAKSVYSVSGNLWSATTGSIAGATGLVNVSGNRWLYTTSTALRSCTITTGGKIEADTLVSTTGSSLIGTINGIMRADATGTTFYIYGSDTSAATGQIQRITISATQPYTAGAVIPVDGLTNVKGLAMNGRLFVAVGEGTADTVSSGTLTDVTWSWVPRGNVSSTGNATGTGISSSVILTPNSIAFGSGRFVVVGTKGTGPSKSTIATAPGVVSGTNNMSWSRRDASTFTSGTKATNVTYLPNVKQFIAINDSSNNIVKSNDGANWGMYTLDATTWSGGTTIGYRDASTPPVDANIGFGILRPTTNVTWDDAYKIRLGTSTICEQRGWAAANRIAWDGVSDYNGCS